jgi:hypothetical protein
LNLWHRYFPQIQPLIVGDAGIAARATAIAVRMRMITVGLMIVRA